MYHENPVINDIVLTVINDGDGSQCGYSYDRRVAAAREVNPRAWTTMARNYRPLASREAIFTAGDILADYYVDHLKELDA